MAKKKQFEGVAIYGIHPHDFQVDLIFMYPNNLRPGGHYITEARYRTDMVELVELPLRLVETMGDQIKATLKERAEAMRKAAANVSTD